MKRFHLERLANPQLLALVAVLLINWALFPSFFRISWQDGRLFGSLIDVLNRGAPVAILAIGMTGVIATKGVDLSVGAIMAVCGAVAATMVVAGYPTPVAVIAALAVGLVCGLWNGFLVAVLDIQPIIATLVLMVASSTYWPVLSLVDVLEQPVTGAVRKPVRIRAAINCDILMSFSFYRNDGNNEYCPSAFLDPRQKCAKEKSWIA